MGHDHHFLSRLDRVKAEHLELALLLYRDSELTRAVLDSARIPDGVDRVAISLGHPERGPFIILSREGRFITCLGEGMHLGDRHVVHRNDVDGIAKYIEVLRSRLKAAQQQGLASETDKMIARIYEAGDSISAEEIHGILFWRELLFAQLHEVIQVNQQRLLPVMQALFRVKRVDRVKESVLARFWRAVWAQGHLAVLCGLELPEGMKDPAILGPGERDPRGFLTKCTIMYSLSSCALRGFWAVGTIGAPLLEHYADLYDNACSSLEIVEGTASLLAIAARHPETRDKVRKVLARPCAPDHPDRQTREAIFKGSRSATLGWLDDPRAAQDEFDRECSAYVESAKELDGLRKLRGGEIPLPLARLLYFHQPFGVLAGVDGMMRTIRMISWVARQKAEDLYLPREVRDVLRPGWTNAKGMMLVGAQRQSYKTTAPIRRSASVGPNDPCTCGSGKKYKRCCGAPFTNEAT